MNNLKNVLVTGATGEIGMQIARAFAQNGYNVAVHTFSKPEEAQKLCDELCKSYNVKAVSVKADVSKKNDVDEMAEKIKKELGDVMWYVAEVCEALDLNLDEVVDALITADRAEQLKASNEE